MSVEDKLLELENRIKELEDMIFGKSPKVAQHEDDDLEENDEDKKPKPNRKR